MFSTSQIVPLDVEINIPSAEMSATSFRGASNDLKIEKVDFCPEKNVFFPSFGDFI